MLYCKNYHQLYTKSVKFVGEVLSGRNQTGSSARQTIKNRPDYTPAIY